ncbi:FAD-binding protein [Anaerotignum propionicum]|uniref:FAD-binding protein n=1 Tax=Anaerotignum propionicum TaxID=28446 RepID=UPI002108FBF6|nr:FAD-binding protein [Anaerotignum propionicum]MCQ4937118.1 FAD-binding protein [Anaerotignum propionicum]
MKNECYDILIIGGGPAGATLARLLPKRYRVILIDKKQKENGFEKPCGGLLSEDAQRSLAQLNITMPKEILADPQIFSVKTIDVETGLIRHYQRTYINLDRHKFDMWLLSLIPDNVKKTNGIVRSFHKDEKGYTVELFDGRIFHTRYIVGADGANSIVRKTLYPNKTMPSYVAIQQSFREQHKTPFYSCIFDKKTSDCCSWSISKDDVLIFGGAFAPQNCRKAFEKQKQRLEKYGFRFGKPLKTEACIVLRPKSYFDICTGKDKAFLIGEAAGFISPSSLEGISFAINSAILLAQTFTLQSKKKEKEYHKKTIHLRIKILLKILKCPFMYHPVLRKLVMLSGYTSIDVK